MYFIQNFLFFTNLFQFKKFCLVSTLRYYHYIEMFIFMQKHGYNVFVKWYIRVSNDFTYILFEKSFLTVKFDLITKFHFKFVIFKNFKFFIKLKLLPKYTLNIFFQVICYYFNRSNMEKAK